MHGFFFRVSFGDDPYFSNFGAINQVINRTLCPPCPLEVPFIEWKIRNDLESLFIAHSRIEKAKLVRHDGDAHQRATSDSSGHPQTRCLRFRLCLSGSFWYVFSVYL